nr:MAG TPA: hypothetical protein [Caudoviricetes sp.]
MTSRHLRDAEDHRDECQIENDIGDRALRRDGVTFLPNRRHVADQHEQVENHEKPFLPHHATSFCSPLTSSEDSDAIIGIPLSPQLKPN